MDGGIRGSMEVSVCECGVTVQESECAGEVEVCRGTVSVVYGVGRV